MVNSKDWLINQVKICREGQSAPFYESMPDNTIKVLLILLQQFTEHMPVPGMEFSVQFEGTKELFEKGFLSITKETNGDFSIKPVNPDMHHANGFPKFTPVTVQ